MRTSAKAGRIAKQPVAGLPVFSTVFAGLVLGTPTSVTGNNNWNTSFTTTTDTVTGYDTSTDIVAAFGASTTLKIESIPEVNYEDADIATYNTVMSNAIQATTWTGKTGAQELELECTLRDAAGAPNPQTHLMVQMTGAQAIASPITEQYWEVVFKLPAGLDLQAAGNDDSTGHFYTVFEMKTGGHWNGSTYQNSVGDFRVVVWINGDDGTDNWHFLMDDQANGSGLSFAGVDFYTNQVAGTVRLDTWTTMKLYYKRPSVKTDLTTGIMQCVISAEGYDDVVLCNLVNDGATQMMGYESLPFTRFFINNYTSAELPNALKVASVEIWDQLPSPII